MMTGSSLEYISLDLPGYVFGGHRSVEIFASPISVINRRRLLWANNIASLGLPPRPGPAWLIKPAFTRGPLAPVWSSASVVLMMVRMGLSEIFRTAARVLVLICS